MLSLEVANEEVKKRFVLFSAFQLVRKLFSIK
jgi:hypothetical protein